MLTAVQVLPGVYYPLYRLVIILATLAVALLLYVLVMRTRIGMLIRAGASNREMVGALGVNIKLLYTLVFGLGAALAGFAGLMQAPILTVQIGMGENILILAFVVIIIGGIGSIRGAFVAAMIVGLIDTIGRAFLPDLVRTFLSYSAGSSLGPSLSSMLIYMLMARCWCSGRRACSRRRANDGCDDERSHGLSSPLPVGGEVGSRSDPGEGVHLFERLETPLTPTLSPQRGERLSWKSSGLPWALVPKDCVKHGQELSSDCDQRDHFWFADSNEPVEEDFQDGLCCLATIAPMNRAFARPCAHRR